MLLATAYNVSRILRYSSSDTRLATQASRDEARAADLRQQATRLRASVDPQQVELASAGARQANDLIDRRTFSWTELLNRFEKTLPDEVRISSVSPRLDRDKGIMLRVHVKARGVEDVQEFMENLEATGAFKDADPSRIVSTTRDSCETTLDMGTSRRRRSRPRRRRLKRNRPPPGRPGRGAEEPVPTRPRPRGATRP